MEPTLTLIYALYRSGVPMELGEASAIARAALPLYRPAGQLTWQALMAACHVLYRREDGTPFAQFPPETKADLMSEARHVLAAAELAHRHRLRSPRQVDELLLYRAG